MPEVRTLPDDVTDQALIINGLEYINGLERASVHDGACAYRTPFGEKCVAGVYIPDSCYHDKMEGKGIEEVIWTNREDLPTWMWHKVKVLTALQKVHDAVLPGVRFQYAVELIAAYGINQDSVPLDGRFFTIEWP